MNQTKELEWTEILRPAPFTIRPSNSRKCTCGNDSCKSAKKIRCTCSCHSANHGAANREGMSPLDETLGFTKEATGPLGSQPEVLRLDPLVSRELIYIG